MDQREIKKRKLSAAARERRRKKRQQIILMQRIIIALLVVVLLTGGGLITYFCVPGFRVARQLQQAYGYIETQAYDEAIASYEEALNIDSKSVKAYRAMAGAYLTKEDAASAEQILHKGWETTQDESLLQYYCTVLLNEAVEEINNQKCTLETLDKCVAVIEKDQNNADVYKLLDACYDRLFRQESEEAGLLCSIKETASCGYQKYQDMLLRLLSVYEANPTEELKNEIMKFAIPEMPYIWLDVKHMQEYKDLLNRVAGIGSTDSLNSLTACIDSALSVQNFFAEAFTIFESGTYEPIRDFMQKQEYIAVRDQFLNGTAEYWSGETYIPVSREKMKLMNENGKWTFAFASFEEYPDTAGVISVWGAKQEDAGVQRLIISYEPVSGGEEYYPHTTYEFLYLYSNVKIGNEYVPKMNYRFETRVATPEGTNTDCIGDWGGEHQWKTEY